MLNRKETKKLRPQRKLEALRELERIAVRLPPPAERKVKLSNLVPHDIHSK